MASECDLGGFGRLMMVGMVVVGMMVMVAVVRVVDPVIFHFKISLFLFHTSENSAHSYTSFYHFQLLFFALLL